LFKKKTAQEPRPTRKRLQRLSMAEVYDWSEVLLVNTGQAFGSWRRGAGEPALDDAEKQLHALLEVCDELRTRERLRA
jgi:hypothetical protein